MRFGHAAVQSKQIAPKAGVQVFAAPEVELERAGAHGRGLGSDGCDA
jgi:hypothetical protein